MIVLGALRDRRVRSYALVQGLSMCGTSMVQALLPWFLIDETRDPAMLVWIAHAFLVPAALGNPFVGGVVDRFGPRQVLLVTQALGVVYNLVLALAIGLEVWSPGLVVSLCWVMGLVTVFDNNARHSFVKTFGEEHLVGMVTIHTTAGNLSRIVGPAVGAWCYGSLGIVACLVLNGLSYVGLTRDIFRAPADRGSTRPPWTFAGSLRGFRELWGGDLRFIVSLAILSSFSAHMFLTLVPLLVKVSHRGDVGTLAGFNAALALGSVLGAVAVRPYAGVGAALRRLVLHMYVMGGGLALLALLAERRSPLTYVVLVVIGYAMTHLYPTYSITIHANVGDDVRARSMSAYASAHLALTPLAAALSIWLFEQVSARGALLTCAAVVGCSVVVLVAYRTRSTAPRRADPPHTEPEPP